MNTEPTHRCPACKAEFTPAPGYWFETYLNASGRRVAAGAHTQGRHGYTDCVICGTWVQRIEDEIPKGKESPCSPEPPVKG